MTHSAYIVLMITWIYLEYCMTNSPSVTRVNFTYVSMLEREFFFLLFWKKATQKQTVTS